MSKSVNLSVFRSFLKTIRKPRPDPIIAQQQDFCRKHIKVFRRLRWKVHPRLIEMAMRDFVKLEHMRSAFQ